jgi:hypothetical protein
MLTLSGSGALLWGVLSRPRSLSESARMLARHFQVPAEDIERDIAPVVEELATQGALVAEVERS